MNRAGHFLGGVALSGRGKKEKQAGIFGSWKAATLRGQSDALVADKRAVKPGGAALGKQVGQHVIDRVVRIAEVRAMIALNVERLALIVNHHAAERLLRRLLD